MNTIEKRFLTKVRKTNTCWLWEGAKRGRGSYGTFLMNGRKERAHRVAWKLYRGEIPTGFCVLHRCDVPNCVRLSHLFLGTQMDNWLDAFRKNRIYPIDKARLKVPFGENHPGHKLFEYQVREIILSDLSEPKLAKQFGVNKGHINRIRNGKVWKSVFKELVTPLEP